MNAPIKGVSAKADRAATPDGAEPVPVSGIAGITDATALWDALGKTDPKHTKGFNRAGGFKGTALKPMWVLRRLTETFGPVGQGWGYDSPAFQVVAAGEEILVYCTVSAWVAGNYAPNAFGDETPARFYGVGGDKVLSQRAGKPFTDDEAFKKAFTDALMNAFKHLGVGADIHMGQFDDSKYVEQVAREFAEGASDGEPDKAHPDAARGKSFPEGPATGIHQLKQLSRPLYRDLAACGDADQLDIVKADNKALLAQIEAAWPDGWNGIDGDGNKYPGFKELLEQKFEREEA